jgi:protein phosphatase
VVADDDSGLLGRASARTNVGQVRNNNEDNLGIWALNGVVIALVADGMGGAAAGEEASRLTLEAVQANFLGTARGAEDLSMWSESELSKRLADAIRDANRAILDKASSNPLFKGMGTTSTLLLVRGNRAIIAHVGDSRVYQVYARGEIKQLTIDHSFVQALVASGHITEDQARTHPMGNVLYRALGQSPDLDVDIFTAFLHSGDRIVMCSDGLTRHLFAEDIVEIIQQDVNPHDASSHLIDLANQRGGEDNISVIVIKVVEGSSEETLPFRPVD